DIVVVGDAIKVFRTMHHGRPLRALGFVSDEELAVLYANATALIFPSLFEGFGIPVIEAQAAGLPVICSDIEVLREVAGQGAIFINPQCGESMAKAIIDVVDSPELRTRMIKIGKENAARYSWRHATEGFLAACRAVMTAAR